MNQNKHKPIKQNVVNIAGYTRIGVLTINMVYICLS